jgi:hypothetical protein
MAIIGLHRQSKNAKIEGSDLDRRDEDLMTVGKPIERHAGSCAATRWR